MIREVYLQSFRGFPRATLELAPITILTGPNNAGKSTIPYALFTLKNVISNPAQPLDSFFNLGFINLGGFKQAVFAKDEDAEIVVAVNVENENTSGRFELSLRKQTGQLSLHVKRPFDATLSLDVTFPYSLTQNVAFDVKQRGHSIQGSWNGLVATIATVTPLDGASTADKELAGKDVSAEVASAFTFPIEEIRRIEMVPLRRGFTKPVYSAVPVQPQLLTEDEVATVLATDADLYNRVDHSLEQIVNRSLRVHTPPSTATSYLHSVNRETGLTSELVNEGFGTNQLVFLLAKMYRPGVSTVCIEEPEIHLHPSAIARFVEVLTAIAKHSLLVLRRQFVISTHSEHFITSILGLIAKRVLRPEDVALYYLSKSGYEASAERCKISEEGQVEGGLRGFYEAELAAVKNLLGPA